MDRATVADWITTDYYALLDVPEQAGRDAITRAYRRRVRAAHPDTNRDAPPGRFQQVHEAYDVLGHQGKRAQYDFVREQARRLRDGCAYDTAVAEHVEEADRWIPRHRRGRPAISFAVAWPLYPWASFYRATWGL